MKLYKKEYEDVYTSKNVLKKCKFKHITTDNGIPIDEYLKLFKKTFKKLEKNFFDDLIKIVWLGKRFCYYEYCKNKYNNNGRFLDYSYGIFLRTYVGFESKILNGIKYFIVSYFDDFFPDFDKKNPFKEKFKYPYKYMNFECLILVYQMPERLELLEHGEKKRMSYIKFVDFVINYVKCHNDEVGLEEYYVTFLFYLDLMFIKVKGYKRKK